MGAKRIDELTTRTVVNTDLLPPTPSGGPSGSATVAAVVKAGLSQPNSASSGAGADITIKAADGVTSGAGGWIFIQPGSQATSGGNGKVRIGVPGYYLTIDGYTITSTEYVRLTSPILMQTHNWLAFGDWIGYEHSKIWHDGYGSGILSIASSSFGIGSQIVSNTITYSMSGNMNNFIAGASPIIRINLSTNYDITGFGPPGDSATQATTYPNNHKDGRLLRVINVGTATLTLRHNSSSSTAANRIYSSTGADIALSANSWADLIYDSINNGSGSAGWRAK